MKILSVLALVLAACSSLPSRPVEDDFGILLMAHGGSEEWNRAVEEVVVPLASRQPVEISFGMADAARSRAR